MFYLQAVGGGGREEKKNKKEARTQAEPDEDIYENEGSSPLAEPNGVSIPEERGRRPRE